MEAQVNDKDPRIGRFVRSLAKFLAGSPVEKGLKISSGDKLAVEWAELRSVSPVHGYQNVAEAEIALHKFFFGKERADDRGALPDVLAERARQDAKWGEQNHDPFAYLAILMEEVGELAQAAVQARMEGGDQSRIREEAVQVAAVALAFVECIDRAKWSWPRG